MKTFFPCICFLLLIFVTTGCDAFLERNAEELLQLRAPQEQSDLSVSQLIERMHEATDPKNVWRDCKSYIMRQSVRLEEQQGFSRVERYYSTEKKFVRTANGDAMLRQTSLLNGVPFMTLIFRDNKGWTISKDGLATTYEPGTGMNLMRNYIGFSDPKATERDLFPTVEVSIVYLDDVRTYRMICRSADPKIYPYVKYIDSQTFLVKRLEAIMHAQDGTLYLYSAVPQDYRWVNDVKIPMQTEVIVGNNSENYFTEEFLINPNIPDKDFELPQSAKIDYTKTK